MNVELELCAYCGELADTVDHVVPQHLLKRAGELELNLAKVLRIKDWILPACRECNSVIGGRVFRTLAERRKCAHDYIRRKYKSYLYMPAWTEEQIQEMGPIAQADIRRGLRVQERTRARLRWEGARRLVWEGDVYDLMRAVIDGKGSQ